MHIQWLYIYCGPDRSGSQGSPVRFPAFRTVVPARMPSNLGENFHPEKWESKPMDCGSFNGIWYNIHPSIHPSIYMSMCIYIYTHTCVCVCLCVSISSHLYIYTYMHIYSCIYIYTNLSMDNGMIIELWNVTNQQFGKWGVSGNRCLTLKIAMKWYAKSGFKLCHRGLG